MACHCLEPIVPGKTFDPFRSTLATSDLEQDMGSTTFGSDGSTGVGWRCRKTSKINRAGSRRVRDAVAPS
jgi:hypothetical protein